MKKIKVLVVPSDRFGVGSFRSIKPHVALEDKYPDIFSIDIDYEPQLNNDEWLKQYDIIHYHRTLGQYEGVSELLNKLDSLGVISIMDLDDHWSVSPSHPAHHIIKKNEIDKKVATNLKSARNITTTTELFEKEINNINKNTQVIPNAINPEEKQYTSRLEKNNRIRIGYLGGSAHLQDLQILEGISSKFKNDGLLDKVQFVLCGYDLRGTTTIINSETGEETQRPIRPQESVWFQYEKIFTDNYSIVSPEYKEFLLKFKNEEFPGVENEPYRRVWTKNISSYANNYNLFDISLAPLEENKFNQVKSELKFVEAGFHKKALLAQDFGPYQINTTPCNETGGVWNEEGNIVLIKSEKNHKDWYKNLKKLVENPELITQMGNNLNKMVNEHYSTDVVTDIRKDYYLKLIKQKNEKNYLMD